MTTMGKYRHLSHCATPAGHFVILAIDHRNNLLRALNQHAPQPLSDAEFMAFKQQVLTALAPQTSAVLTDPAYGIGAAVASGAVGGWQGLLAPIEVTDYDLHPSQRTIQYIPDWSAAKIKRCGGDGVKLLLPYHPEADNAAEKRAVVSRVVADCKREDIPFFLEPIAYSLDAARGLAADELRQITVAMAHEFSRMGVDVLKLQFPVDPTHPLDEADWKAACAEVNAACLVPWTILSGGVDFETFARQVTIACQAGASGVIVGRAVWNEAVTMGGDARAQFLADTARARIQRLASICAATAAPWQTRVAAPNHAPDWYV